MHFSWGKESLLRRKLQKFINYFKQGNFHLSPIILTVMLINYRIFPRVRRGLRMGLTFPCIIFSIAIITIKHTIYFICLFYVLYVFLHTNVSFMKARAFVCFCHCWFPSTLNSTGNIVDIHNYLLSECMKVGFQECVIQVVVDFYAYWFIEENYSFCSDFYLSGCLIPQAS